MQQQTHLFHGPQPARVAVELDEARRDCSPPFPRWPALWRCGFCPTGFVRACPGDKCSRCAAVVVEVEDP